MKTTSWIMGIMSVGMLSLASVSARGALLRSAKQLPHVSRIGVRCMSEYTGNASLKKDWESWNEPKRPVFSDGGTKLVFTIGLNDQDKSQIACAYGVSIYLLHPHIKTMLYRCCAQWNEIYDPKVVVGITEQLYGFYPPRISKQDTDNDYDIELDASLMLVAWLTHENLSEELVSSAAMSMRESLIDTIERHSVISPDKNSDELNKRFDSFLPRADFVWVSGNIGWNNGSGDAS